VKNRKNRKVLIFAWLKSITKVVAFFLFWNKYVVSGYQSLQNYGKCGFSFIKFLFQRAHFSVFEKEIDTIDTGMMICLCVDVTGILRLNQQAIYT